MAIDQELLEVPSDLAGLAGVVAGVHDFPQGLAHGVGLLGFVRAAGGERVKALQPVKILPGGEWASQITFKAGKPSMRQKPRAGQPTGFISASLKGRKSTS